MAFVRSILQAYERRGISPDRALSQARITRAEAGREDARITAAQLEEISRAAMIELDDEALGWFSKPLPWGSNGMLCRASISSPNLEVALKRWCRHHRLLVSDVEVGLHVEGEVATVTIAEKRSLGASQEFCLVSMLRNLHGIACWLIDTNIPIKLATFTYAAPPHASVYTKMFAEHIEFDAQRTSMSFDSRYLAHPLRRDDEALRTMLSNKPLLLLVLQYRPDRLMSYRLLNLLRANPGDFPNAAECASALHVSTRTLYRQLADEGASLQSLKNQARREEAMNQLSRTNRSIKQIASALGFRSSASFDRAFRLWTGATPSDYRQASVPREL